VTIETIHGDSFDVLDGLEENSHHAVVTDPPYNFEGGFMQEEWDDIGSGTEYQKWCQEWAEKCKRVLKAGGHLIAFSGNRSHHRLMCGVEDAGYEIRDTITWHYGNGFPKGASIERWLDEEYKEKFGDWRGMLKPATEFAVLARAPLEGTSASRNQMEHGTGNLNVEACRIGDEEMEYQKTSGNVGVYNEIDEKYGEDTYEGRFPPNLALDPVMASVMDMQSADVGGGEVSRFFYCSKASQSERNHSGEVNNDHPTVKPLDLMQWLVRMVTVEEQKVLDPFAGSGTTAVACHNEGRSCTAIEMEEEYVDIINERLDEVM